MTFKYTKYTKIMIDARKYGLFGNIRFPQLRFHCKYSRLAKKREILIFPRTAGNTGNSREILEIPGNYWEIGVFPTTKKE